MTWRWIACAMVLLLLAPVGAAQEGQLRVTLAPADISTWPGRNETSLVTIENDGVAPLTVTLSHANATGGLVVTFDDTQLTVLPGAPETTTARVRGDTPGNWSVTVRATSNSTLGSATASAILRVGIAPHNATGNATGNATNATSSPAPNETAQEPPVPDDAPSENATEESAPTNFSVEPGELRLEARPGEAAPFAALVRSGKPVNVTMRLPLGWGGALDATTLAPENGSATLSGRVVPGASARDAEGELIVTNGEATARVRLMLRALAAEPAPEPVAAVQDPPSAEEPTQQPVATPSSPATSARPWIEVTPAESTGAPGASVLLTVRVVNPGDGVLIGRLAEETSAFAIELGSPEIAVAARSEAFATIAVRIPATASAGESATGRVTLEGVGEDTFLVRVATADAALAAELVPDARGGAWGWAVVAGAAIAVGSAAAWRRWPAFGLFALYARLAPHRALEHPRRARILGAVREEPGLTLAALQRRLDLTNGVARHHLELLKAAGALRVVKDGALSRVWPTDAPRVDPAPPLGERALATIRARGTMRASELASELGVSRQALHYHLKRLAREGRIVARREASELVLSPAQA